MARDFAISHSSKARPYGQPADGWHRPRPTAHAAGSARNVQAVNPVGAPPVQPQACSATTKAGAPCRALPVTGTDLCVFHAQQAGDK